MAQFYIVQKSNWQGDTWKPVAGPFASRSQAQADIGTYEYHPVGPFGLDLKSQTHAKVISRTKLIKLGYSRTPAGQGKLVADLCAHKENWMDFITA